MQKFLRHLFLRTSASSCNNDSKPYNDNLLHENKPPALAGIRIDNGWSICHLSFAVPENILKRESFAQTNLVYNRPSLSFDLV